MSDLNYPISVDRVCNLLYLIAISVKVNLIGVCGAKIGICKKRVLQ